MQIVITAFSRNILQIIKAIPEGKVLTYGIIAALAGNPRAARQVSRVLHSMSAKHKQASRAFKLLRNKVTELKKGLIERNVKEDDIRVSHLTVDMEEMFLGKQTAAVTTFFVKIDDLKTLQDILVYIIDNGGSLKTAVSFGTTLLKEKRVKARIRAIEAAREKAQVYAKAAKVEFGKPVHIEDLNPDELEVNYRTNHFTGRLEGMEKSIVEDEGGFDAGWLPVDAAVMVTYEIVVEGMRQ